MSILGRLAASRRKHMLLGAGVGMCLLAYPASVVANGSSTSRPVAHTSSGGSDTCGYPSGSGKAATAFSENTLARLIQVNGSGLNATVSAFATDEKSIILGVTDPGSSATVTPFVPAAGQSFGHASNPSLGDLSLADASGRPEFPSIFVSNLTTDGAGSHAGDWQQGGAAQAKVSDVFGTWVTGTFANGNGGLVYQKPQAPAQQNNFSFGPGADTAASSLGTSQGYGTELRWNVGTLVDDHGHALVPGDTYRFQVLLHDGDQNKTGGDVGELCTTLTAPLPQPGNLAGHIFDCGPTPLAEELGGSITFAGQAAKANPVLPFSVPAGSYGTSATAPPGFHFVQCNSTAYHINSDGSATYNSPLQVPAGGTTTAIFFVQPTPPPLGPSFVVKKTVDPVGSVPINTELTYTVTVKNTGDTAGSPGTLHDVLHLSGGATYQIVSAATADKGTATDTGGGTWSWDLTAVTLAKNQSASFHVTIRALTPGTLTNSAVLPNSNCAEGDATPDPNCSTTTPVNLVLTKSNAPDDSAPIAEGTVVTYTITLTNPTDNDAVDVPMTDVMTGTAGISVDTTSFMATVALKGSSAPTCDTSACTSFHWTWTVAKHAFDKLTYRATIESAGTTSSSVGSLTMINTVSTPGLPPVTVSNHTPGSGVQGTTTGTPSTGGFPEMNVTIAGFMFLGGLGLILVGILARKPRVGTMRAM